MSHRVTVESEIKDLDVLRAAVSASKGTLSGTGTVRITGGAYSNVSVNLKTGEVSGDTDYDHTAAKIGLLRQAYAEAKYHKEAAMLGITVTDREVQKNGNIVLRCVAR